MCNTPFNQHPNSASALIAGPMRLPLWAGPKGHLTGSLHIFVPLSALLSPSLLLLFPFPPLEVSGTKQPVGTAASSELSSSRC